MVNLLLLYPFILDLFAFNGVGTHFLKNKEWSDHRVPWIRVLVKEDERFLSFSPKETTLSLHQQKNSSGLKFDRHSLRLTANCQGLGGKVRPAKSQLLASLWNKDGRIALDHGEYYGRIEYWFDPIKKNCQLVNELPLEVYLVSLLGHEVAGNWPIEALKAQAIAARTYAYQKINQALKGKEVRENDFFYIKNSEKHQVSGNFNNIHDNQRKAIEESWGEVLLDKEGHIGEIFFHAECGGRTFTSGEIWQNEVTGSASVVCPYCQKNARPWSYEMSYQDFWGLVLKKDAQFSQEKIEAVNIFRDRVILSNKQGKLILKKSEIRKFVGEKKIRSHAFDIKAEKNKIMIQGKGHGHGVGLCQMGMKELAEKGYTYKQILAHYYPYHKLQKMY
jgi:stage II sporulation protein D